MLSTLGTRIARPAAQAAWRFASPPRARFTVRAVALAENSGNRLNRGPSQQVSVPGSRSVARRPFRLATEQFFPEQVGSIFRDIEDEISRLWGDHAETGHGQLVPANRAFGAADIQETKDGYHFTLDAPGLTKGDISVRITPDNVLMISGERSFEDKKEEDGFRRVERSYGKFQRRFVLPDHVDTAGITAEVKHGVLQVTVPKKESEKRELTDIPVQDGSAAPTEAPASA